MAVLKKVEYRTLQFIEAHKQLKSSKQMVTHDELAKIIGVESKTTVSEILGKRQNIQPDQWLAFKEYFKISDPRGSEKPVQSDDRIDLILSNLNEIREYAISLITGQTAGQEVIMGALDRLEKNPEGSLSEAADRLALKLAERMSVIQTGKKAEAGK